MCVESNERERTEGSPRKEEEKETFSIHGEFCLVSEPDSFSFLRSFHCVILFRSFVFFPPSFGWNRKGNDNNGHIGHVDRRVFVWDTQTLAALFPDRV